MDDRADLLRRLIAAMKRNIYKAFSETVLIVDWQDVDREYRLQESHCTPYALAGFFVMDRTIRWWGRKHPHDSMTEFVFDDGDKGKGDFIWMMDNIIKRDKPRLNLLSPVFKTKVLAQLQAADLAAWPQHRTFKLWVTKQPEQSLLPAVIDALLGGRSYSASRRLPGSGEDK